MSDLLAPVLSDQWGQDKSWKLSRYEAAGGYRALRKALLGMTQAEVIALVKDAGLRGRGGAGFPTGMKWSFVPQDNPTRSTSWSTLTNRSPAPARTCRC